MTNDITPLQSIQNTIKDKIRAEFANLIPDDMWKGMVQSVVSEFITDKKDGYSGRASESPIKAMIRQEIEKMAKAHLTAELDRLGTVSWNSYGQQVAAEAIKKMISEHFAEMLAAVQAGFVEVAVMQAVQNLRNSMSRGNL